MRIQSPEFNSCFRAMEGFTWLLAVALDTSCCISVWPLLCSTQLKAGVPMPPSSRAHMPYTEVSTHHLWHICCRFTTSVLVYKFRNGNQNLWVWNFALTLIPCMALSRWGRAQSCYELSYTSTWPPVPEYLKTKTTLIYLCSQHLCKVQKYCDPVFLDGKLDINRLNDLLKVTQEVCNRVGK